MNASGHRLRPGRWPEFDGLLRGQRRALTPASASPALWIEDCAAAMNYLQRLIYRALAQPRDAAAVLFDPFEQTADALASTAPSATPLAPARPALAREALRNRRARSRDGDRPAPPNDRETYRAGAVVALPNAPADADADEVQTIPSSRHDRRMPRRTSGAGSSATNNTHDPAAGGCLHALVATAQHAGRWGAHGPRSKPRQQTARAGRPSRQRPLSAPRRGAWQ